MLDSSIATDAKIVRENDEESDFRLSSITKAVAACPLIILDPHNFTMTARNSTSISFEWTPAKHNLSITPTYRVDWTGEDDTGSTVSEYNATTCSNLMPGKMYKFTLFVRVSDDNKPSPASVSTAQNSLTLPNITIYFKLAEGIVDYYEATLTGGSVDSSTERVSNNTDHVIFQVLYGDTNYTLTLVTRTGNLTSESFIQNVITDITNPEQVENPNVSSKTSLGFLISWSPPKHPNGDIIGYMIKAFIGQACYANITIKCVDDVKSDGNETEATSPNRIKCQDKVDYSISGLIPAQTFTVTVAAVNAAGVGKLSTLNASTTDGKNIMDVDNVTWTKRTETEISFMWVTPHLREPFTNVNYSFTWTPHDGKSNSTSEDHTTILDLTPGQLYIFTLDINLYDGERWLTYTHEPSVTVRTSPSQPDITHIDQDESNINILWNPAEGIVGYYNVTLTLRNDSAVNEIVSNSTNKVTFTSLYGDTQYILKIITNTGNLASKPLIQNIKTNVTNPEQVENPKVSSETSSGFLISWSPPQHPNGEIIGYTIKAFIGQACYANITINCTNDVEPGGNETEVTPPNRIKCQDKMNYTISGLIPAQNFTVTIAAVNAAGVGKLSTLNGSTTDGNNTMDVHNFTWTNRTETEIRFEWETPDIGSPFTNVTYNFTWTPREEKSYSTSENHTTISDLTPGQLYSFTLHINLYDGERWLTYTHGSSVTVRTSPSQPNITDIDQVESNITILWNPAEGIVDYYNLTLKLHNDSAVNEIVYNSTNKVTFTDLYGDTQYLLKIITYTGNLISKPLIQNIKTNVTNPEEVEDPNVSSETSSGFLISWSPPQHTNGEIIAYMIKAFIGQAYYANVTVNCTNDGKPSENQMEATSPNRIKSQDRMNYSISGLIPAQNFTITIAAVNAAGVGRLSTLNASTTGGKNIMDVDKFTWTNRTETDISFEWVTPHFREPFTNVTYNFTWTPREGKSHSTSENHTIISDLTPGQLYSFTLYINLFDGERWLIYTHESSVTVRTSPSQPHIKRIDQVESNITIQLNPADGIVDYYNVTLQLPNNSAGNEIVFNSTNEVTFTDLYGDTTYLLKIITYTGNLTSRPLINDIKTNVTRPGLLENITVTPLTASSVEVSWTSPRLYPGPTDYTIELFEEKSINSSTYRFNTTILIHGYLNSTYIIQDLLSYWHYNFSVMANTSTGSSNSLSDITRTKESAPGLVQTLLVRAIPGNYTEVNVTWACPAEKERNGRITKYSLRYTPDQQNKNILQSGNEIDYNLMQPSDPCTSLHTLLLPVTPEVNYTFSVTAFTVDKGRSSGYSFYTQPGKPPKLDKYAIILIPKESEQPQQKETRFNVHFCGKCLLDKTNGMITFVAMIVCKTGASCQQVSEIHKPKEVSSWYSWNKNNFKGIYRPTPDTWLIDTPEDAINNVNFEVGRGKDCSMKPTEYCNGPLDTGSQYSLKFMVCTRAGCTQSEFQDGYVTKVIKPSVVGPVVGAISGIVVAALVVAGVWYYKRRYRNRKNTEDDEQPENEELVDLTRPIKMTDFSSRLKELHNDSNLLFITEYKELQANSPKKPHEISSLEPNRVKNRYVNILAFDHSLVKLLPIDEDDNTDYINANFIPGYNSPREYIATQGPQDSTINDFWRMIWEKNVPIIVMLTGVKEGMKQKCAQYWPEHLNVPSQYGDIVITLEDRTKLGTYTLKTFKLCLGKSERTVKHFFMHDWRDYDANLTPTDVVNFICDVRRARPSGDSVPMVVHCSAGVGRTGTFIALDYFIQFIEQHSLEDNVDIFQFVLKMRGNRPLMVQSEAQYVFLHETVDMLIKQKIIDEESHDNDVDNEGIYQNEAFVAEDIYVNVENGKMPV
ncbi:receptor-type tyrosine-protein phosphatase eta-like [Gigantopelta aegis]|uniref:receptor-type tyrosine-protein phosphatase eta-like n=1 Tax=Gigantopelta aegis TaxID=1735272 RepID=UPI001B88CDC5|nr:receptor-type tyrosine-protein phosphatase eta-like [Gigantopelta aegis]